MESIELERGWLARQMQEVHEKVQDWPEVLTPLRTLNASLVRQPNQPGSPNEQAVKRTEASEVLR